MRLPGCPDTERAWLDRAKNGNWKFSEIKGRGRGGIKRVYVPPPEIMALIEGRQRGELQPEALYRHKVQERAGPLGVASPALAEYVVIPLYDVCAATCGGAVVDHEHMVDFLHFKLEWIRQELRAVPDDLYLIYVDGESMEPMLRPGDIILVDHRDQAQARDGVYVLRLDKTLLVKRLQKMPGGMIKVSSDNPAYQPFTLKLAEMKEQDFEIIGRVVWTGRRM